jgi:hypothetical protein
VIHLFSKILICVFLGLVFFAAFPSAEKYGELTLWIVWSVVDGSSVGRNGLE